MYPVQYHPQTPSTPSMPVISGRIGGRSEHASGTPRTPNYAPEVLASTHSTTHVPPLPDQLLAHAVQRMF